MAQENENQEEHNQEEHQEEVETVSKADYDAIVAERDALKPVEKSESEQAMETKQQELWQKEVALTLKENGLDKFADVIKVKDADELNTTIEALNGIVDQYKVENAYVPENHAKQDEYDNAKNSGDTQGMIKSLFGFK